MTRGLESGYSPEPSQAENRISGKFQAMQTRRENLKELTKEIGANLATATFLYGLTFTGIELINHGHPVPGGLIAAFFGLPSFLWTMNKAID